MPPSPNKLDSVSLRSYNTSNPDVTSPAPSDVTSTPCTSVVISGEDSPSQRPFDSKKDTMTSQQEPMSASLGQCDAPGPQASLPESTDCAKGFQDDDLSPVKSFQQSQNSHTESFQPARTECVLWNGEFSFDVPPSQRALLLTLDRYLREGEQQNSYQDRLRRAMETSQRRMKPSAPKTQIFQFTTVHPPGPGPKAKGDTAKTKLYQYTTIIPPRPRSEVKGDGSRTRQFQHATTCPQRQHSVELGWSTQEGRLEEDDSSSEDSESCSPSDNEDKIGLVKNDKGATPGGEDVLRKTKRQRGGRQRRRGDGKVVTPCCHELIIAGLLVCLALCVLLLRYLFFPAQDS